LSGPNPSSPVPPPARPQGTGKLPSDLEGLPAEACVARLHRDGATGAFEIVDDKKRRVFFFQNGALVFTHSNLKSESAERVAERFPGVSPADVPRVQAAVRLGAVLALPGSPFEWHAGQEPPRPLPLSVAEVLHEALTVGMDGETLLLRIGSGNPSLVGAPPVAVESLPVSSRLQEWLAALDGEQGVREVLQFGPEDPDACARALYLARLLGIVDVVAEPVRRITAEGVGGAGGEVSFRGRSTRAEPPAADRSEDISRLIAQSVRQASEPARPAAEPAPPVPLNVPAVDNPDAMALRRQIDRIEAGENHFDVLGVPWDHPVEEFRSAYFGIARALHPDRIATHSDTLKQQATAAFEKARAAWEALKEEESRQAYIDRVIHGKKSEDEIAMETVQTILEAETIFKRGMAAFNAGQVIKAHTAFEEAHKKVPDEPEFAAYFGYTLFRTNAGRNDQTAEEGIGMLRSSLEKGKKMDGPWVLLGRIYRDRNEDDKARRCFVQALRINASNSDAIREMERMKRAKEKTPDPGKGGFLSRLFGKKKETKEKKES